MDAVITIATIPAILALVQLAKTFGVTGKWATLLAVILGVVLQAAEYAVTAEPTAPGWYAALATGLILGLSAAGLYDAAKVASPTVEAATIEVPTDIPATSINAEPIPAIDDATYIAQHVAPVGDAEIGLDDDPVGALTAGDDE